MKSSLAFKRVIEKKPEARPGKIGYNQKRQVKLVQAGELREAGPCHRKKAMNLLSLLLLLPAQTVESKDFSKAAQLAALSATVRLNGASGAVVGRAGPLVYILTSSHVVGEAATVNVETFSPASYPKPLKMYREAKVLARMPVEDLALVRIATQDELPGGIEILPPDRMPREHSFPALIVGCHGGCNKGNPPICQVATVSGKKRLRRPQVDGIAAFWELDPDPGEGGRSGGPLVDKNGYLIGVCSGGNQGKGYCSHLEEIYKLLRNNALTWLVEEEKKK